MRKGYETCEVDMHLQVERLEIDCFWLGEFVGTLKPCVEEDTINIRM